MVNGRIVPATFHAADKVNEAEVGSREIKFIYERKGEYWFAEANDPSKRFFMSNDAIGPQARFLKGNMVVTALTFSADEDEEAKIIGVQLPIKVELAVKEAPPSIKGDTASGGGKNVTLETGATVTAPLFVNAGDVIRINTETGEYVERVEKR
ncbi:elongation factor P [Candidatus Parcubacteria bacterium]|nr:elongation factor P [Candidatus Parcubacteria bacterium]